MLCGKAEISNYITPLECSKWCDNHLPQNYVLSSSSVGSVSPLRRCVVILSFALDPPLFSLASLWKLKNNISHSLRFLSTWMSYGQFNTTYSRLNLLLPFSILPFAYILYLTKCQPHFLKGSCQKPQIPLTTLSLILPYLINAQVPIILISRNTFRLASPLYSYATSCI